MMVTYPKSRIFSTARERNLRNFLVLSVIILLAILLFKNNSCSTNSGTHTLGSDAFSGFPPKPFDGFKQCPICGLFHVFKLGKKSLTEAWDGKFSLTWMRCWDCGHSYVWPLLSNRNLSDIYSTSYGAQAPVEKAKSLGSSQFEQLKGLNLITDKSAGLKVLEQGCAHGAFLKHFVNFSSQIFCLEPDIDVSAELITGHARKKLTLIRSVEVTDATMPDNSMDFWLGSHVIEHFADPNRFISTAFKKLKPGGIFFQEFPLKLELPGNDMAINYHLHYFTGKSIHTALTKHGFCQNAIFRVYNIDGRYKGPEYWPDVSKTEISKSVQQQTSGIYRAVYNKCKQ